MRRVHLEIVGPECVDQVGLHMRPALPDAAVPAVAFTAVYLCQFAVHADEEDIQAAEQAGQVLAPGAELDDVLDDQVIPGCGQRGQAPVKAIEEPRPHLLPPGERAVWIAPGRQHAAGQQVIRRHVQERFRQCLLHRLRQR